MLFIGCLEAQDQDGLGIGCPEKTPSVIEGHPNAVDVDDPVGFPVVLPDGLHDVEFDPVRTVNADFGRAEGSGNIGKQVAQTFSGFGKDLQ